MAFQGDNNPCVKFSYIEEDKEKPPYRGLFAQALNLVLARA
jgi:hypothetical protein